MKKLLLLCATLITCSGYANINDELINAVQKKEHAKVKKLIAAGADVNLPKMSLKVLLCIPSTKLHGKRFLRGAIKRCLLLMCCID